MTTYVQIHGGVAEQGEVCALWAWQIQALGLNKRATAQLYPAQDMSELLLASYTYFQTWVLFVITG